MTTKNEPQCGFCGGTEFDFMEDLGEWMFCGCGSPCNMWMNLRKADPTRDADEEPNRSTAIDRYAGHTKRLAMQILKNGAVIETK